MTQPGVSALRSGGPLAATSCSVGRYQTSERCSPRRLSASAALPARTIPSLSRRLGDPTRWRVVPFAVLLTNANPPSPVGKHPVEPCRRAGGDPQRRAISRSARSSAPGSLRAAAAIGGQDAASGGRSRVVDVGCQRVERREAGIDDDQGRGAGLEFGETVLVEVALRVVDEDRAVAGREVAHLREGGCGRHVDALLPKDLDERFGSGGSRVRGVERDARRRGRRSPGSRSPRPGSR